MQSSVWMGWLVVGDSVLSAAVCFAALRGVPPARHTARWILILLIESVIFLCLKEVFLGETSLDGGIVPWIVVTSIKLRLLLEGAALAFVLKRPSASMDLVVEGIILLSLLNPLLGLSEIV